MRDPSASPQGVVVFQKKPVISSYPIDSTDGGAPPASDTSTDGGAPDAGDPLAKNRDLLGRGRALLRDGKNEDALRVFLEAQRVMPDDCETLDALAGAHARSGDFPSAAAAYKTFLSLKCDEDEKRFGPRRWPPGDYPDYDYPGIDDTIEGKITDP